MTITTSEALNLTADLKYTRISGGYQVQHNGVLIGVVHKSSRGRWSGTRPGRHRLPGIYDSRKVVGHWLATFAQNGTLDTEPATIIV